MENSGRARKNGMEKYRQFREVVEKIRVGVIIVNKDGFICYANPFANDLLGGGEGGVLGAPFEKPLAGGSMVGIDARLPGKAQGIAEMMAVEITWDGEAAFLILIQEVTENKKINEQLCKLSQAVEQSMSCIVITDVDGNIQYANPKFTETTGYTMGEILGQNPRILKSGKTTPEEYKELWNTITSGNCWQGEFYNKKKNGEYYWELAQITPVKNHAGKIISFLGIKEDITEIKRVARMQEELREQLYHAQKLESVGRLAGGVAHDFNNILMAVMGYANLIEFELKDNGPAKEYLRNILTVAERGAKLTQRMLAFSRKQILEIQRVDLNYIVKESRVLTDRLLREEIKYNAALSEKKLVVMADKNQMEQVIINLVTNAIDAIPYGGTIAIKTGSEIIDDTFIKIHGFGKKGEYAVFSISDTGIGMERETRKKIYEPFFTTKEVGKGTGLGLSIVYGIVKQHNGFIDVHSEYGGGSTFFVYLPLANESAVMPVGSFAEIKDVSAGNAGQILVAEDDESVRFLIKEVLEKVGYRVIAAINGLDAVERYKENKEKIDLLIFDIKMPGMNGKEAYDEIKKITPGMKAIFISGYSEGIIDQSLFEGNSVSFVKKPVLPSKLIEKIRKMSAKEKPG